MGCGRSTLGSDSPKKHKKNEGDSECDSDGDSSSSGGGGGPSRRQQQLSNKLVALGAGGPLLAQAKISDSQQDFFMMLDEKIENGPDYDSETEEAEKRRKLQECAQQWGGTVNTIQASSPCHTPSIRLHDEDACGSGDITEDDEDEDEPGRIPDEAVREQYMFMGNLYTLTHIRTDSDKTEPKVDVVTVPQHDPPEECEVREPQLGHKLNGSAVQEEGSKAENGTAEGGMMDGKPPASRSSPRPSSRPASLILRSVFPADTVQE